jgi:hypothetical protein
LTLVVPTGDRFQVLNAGGYGAVAAVPDYLGIHRSDGIICIQIALARGRTTEQNKALYARIAELLRTDLRIRRDDLLTNLVEAPRRTGRSAEARQGEAQFADDFPAHLRELVT